ncbi:hypothetical protein MHYP_G00273950 [Metynnis hypsauchen]
MCRITLNVLNVLVKVLSGEENTPGWIPAEDDGRTKTPFWCPLLACRMPVFTSKAQDRKVSIRQYRTPKRPVPHLRKLKFLCTTTSGGAVGPQPVKVRAGTLGNYKVAQNLLKSSLLEEGSGDR